jgi:hypothetical protein
MRHGVFAERPDWLKTKMKSPNSKKSMKAKKSGSFTGRDSDDKTFDF